MAQVISPTIHIGGQEFADWDSVELVTALDRKTAYARVRSFNIQRILSMGGDAMQISEAFKEATNKIAAFRYDREDVMHCFANGFQSVINENEDFIAIEFRSPTQDAVDSSIGKRPGAGSAFTEQTTVREAIGFMLQGHDIQVVYDDPAIANSTIDKFKPSPTATVMSEIVRLLSQFKQTVWDEGAGSIVVADLSKRRPVGVLTMDNMRHASISISFDNSKLFNTYVFTNHKPDNGEDSSQQEDFFGSEESQSSDATSFTVPIVRNPKPFPGRRRLFYTAVPRRIESAEIVAKANYDINRSHASILNVNIRVWDWTNPEGNIWRVGDIYRVKLDERNIDMEMMLSGLTLSHNPNEQTATLNLTDARAWSPDYTIKTNAKQELNGVDYLKRQ